MENNNEITRVPVAFAAIDPFIEQNIVLPTETKARGKDMVEWGQRNAYPDYLLELAKNTPSLRSVINGTTDFIVGDDQEILPLADGKYAEGVMNEKGDTIRSQVEAIARDYETYGGFALQVIRGLDGKPVEIYHIDLRYLRSNKDNSVFYYCEKWKEGKTKEAIVYPAYQQIDSAQWAAMLPEERDRVASSIVFVKNITTQVYPFPVYGAAVKACEIERAIDNYHLNAINNGFTSSMIVNFNNGVPDDKIKEEIEKAFAEKFTGHQNAGRVMFSWNPDRANATSITEPKVENFGDRYRALSQHSRQQIFTAFQANPNLFGIPTENNGFSNDEYAESFKLYNRTHIVPVQKMICDAYDFIYAHTDVLKITPFSLGEEDTTQTLATQLGVGGTQAMMAVLESGTLSTEQKKGALQVLFGLDEEKACTLLGIPYVPPVEPKEE